MKIIYNAPNVTIAFGDNQVIQTTITRDQLNAILDLESPTFEEVLSILDSSIKEKIEIEKAFDSRFKIEGNCLYYKGIDLSIPEHLANDLKQALQDNNDKEVQKLINFWKWVSLIQVPESRESFYAYTKANKGIITKEGFYIAFRRVFKVSYYDEAYKLYQQRKKNKKSTNINVFVTKDNKVGLSGVHLIGNLSDFVKNKGQFRSYHTNSDGEHEYFSIGKETRLLSKNVDWSSQECSKGLHCSNGGYSFNSYGDTPIAVLINPMDVVHCPYADHSKMRVMAMTPIQVLEKDCEFTMTDEVQELISSLNSDYITRLENLLQKASFEELNKNNYLPQSSVVHSLNVIINENNDLVKNRLIKL